MSPQLHYEIARARQQEIATRTIHANHGHDMRGTANRRRTVVYRFGEAVAALGICLAIVVALTVGGAHANPRTAKPAGHLSAQQLARDIRALEVKGYVPVACTVHGTLMRNYSTGQSLTLDW